MRNFEEVNKTICEMRQTLYNVINEKDNLLDPEVITASQRLDLALNEYDNLVSKAIN